MTQTMDELRDTYNKALRELKEKYIKAIMELEEETDMSNRETKPLNKSRYNGQISENWYLSEFSCTCKTCQMPDSIANNIRELVIKYLQPLRDRVGCAIYVNSGYRCAARNAAVGGAKYSQHKNGTAADITCDNLSPSKLRDVIREMFGDVLAIGSYNNFTHVDCRPVPAGEKPKRW